MSNMKIEGAHVRADQRLYLEHAKKKASIEDAARYLRQAFAGYTVETAPTYLKVIAPAGNPVALLMLRDKPKQG